MRIYNFVNFENLIHMKLYSLLILRKNTKKFKNNFEAQTKTKLGLFPGPILSCKHNNLCIQHFIPHITKSQTVGSKPHESSRR